MSHPIDIIANAIRTQDGDNTMGAGRLAEVAADTLTDARIAAHAAEALAGDMPGWLDMNATIGELIGNRQALEAIAGRVLRSVGGA